MIEPAELDRFEPFRQLSAAGRKLLVHGVVVHAAPRDAALLHKGQPISGAYIVLKGRLRVFTITPAGAEATLYFALPGEACVLTLNCLFNDLLYPAWVQSEAATTVAIVPGPVYRRLFETERVIQNLTVKALSTLVYRLVVELEQVHSNNQRQRLAQFILLHADGNGSLAMTQQQIADHLGTAREVVARLVQQFVAKRFIQTRRGMICVRDLFGLRRIVAPERPRPGTAGPERTRRARA